MAAHHSCCDGDAARAAARARRRVVKLRRSPSLSSLKARKLLRQQQASGKRPGARWPLALAAPSRKKSVATIRRKMESLSRLVAPAVCGGGSGGERLDELLLHAAGYIVRLQMQVRVMQVMVHALNNPDD